MKAVAQEVGITKYPEELAAEAAIWKRMHPYAYDGPHWNENDDEARAGQG